jgi:hypothetical protein
MSLESRSRVTVWVEPGPWGPLGDLGVFKTRTGGNADSEEFKDRPGGGAGEVALGGTPTTENVTTTRTNVPERDGPLRPVLRAARGKARMVVTEQPLDRNNNAIGAPDVWTGILKAVDPGDSDSMSSDPKLLTLEQSTDAQVG